MTNRGGIGRPFVTTWTDAQCAEIERLWRRGDTASSIARALDKTKNSIIGKANRMNLPGRPSPIKRGKPTIKKATRKAFVPALDIPMPPARSNKVSFVATRPLKLAAPAANGKLCLWPMWPHADKPAVREAHEFCGEPRQSSSSYCPYHHEEAHTRWTGWGQRP